jgi:hypothetical protein
VATVVLLAVVYGFTKIETPSEVREMNIDQTQISDLMNIQSTVQSYAVVESKLPATLKDAFGGLSVPEASEGRDAYTYRVLSATNFELCAEFAFPTSESERSAYGDFFVTEPMGIKDSYNWNHKAGSWCFERAVTPSPEVKN